MVVCFRINPEFVFYLDRVEGAVAVEWKAHDMCGVLIPAGIWGIIHDISDLRENLIHHNPVGTHGDPLTDLWSHTNHNTLTLLTHSSTFTLRPPALQLGL